MAKPSVFKTALALLSNIVISVVIVLLNKWIYKTHGFPNMSLTCVHFVVTSCGMELARRADIFMVKTLPIKDMVLLSMSFCGFVVLTNLSLQANTVGTYQISKFMTTPCIVAIQSIFFGKSFSQLIKLTLVSYVSFNYISICFVALKAWNGYIYIYSVHYQRCASDCTCSDCPH